VTEITFHLNQLDYLQKNLFNMASLGLYSKQLTPVLRCALPTTNRLVPRSTTRLFSISNKQRQSSNDDHPKPIKVDGHSSGGGFSRTQPDIRVGMQ